MYELCTIWKFGSFPSYNSLFQVTVTAAKIYLLEHSFELFDCTEFNSEDEIQQLSLSTDFLVELSDGIFAKV